MKEVAVIIPAYKCHDTIKRTLHSISMQSLIEFNTYLIVDGEEKGSYDYLKDFFDIEIHYLDKNSGPAVSRQTGIDISQEPFISFIDADDTYLSSLALYYQHKHFTDNIVLVSCDFLEEMKNHELHLRQNDMVWMHGKMYRREFLDKYDIRFNDTRANEDVGFNTQCQCYANKDEQVYLAQDVTYMWQWRDNSTVRTDNASYAYNQSIEGYVKNKVYAFNRVIKRNGDHEDIKFFIMSSMIYIFKKYLASLFKAPKQSKFVMKWAKTYYKAVYKQIDKAYIDKALQTVLAKEGLQKPEHLEEFNKWMAQISGNKA